MSLTHGDALVRRRRSGRRRQRGLSDKGFALLLIAPAALFLGVLVGWPLIRLITDSFYEIAPLAGTRTWVGLGNYRNALGSSEFTGAAERTAIYTLIVVTLELTLGLITALLFNAIGRRSQLLRTAFLYPLMIAPIVAGLLWRFLLIDKLRHRQRAARTPRNPAYAVCDQLAERSEHRALLGRPARHLADHVVHVARALRGAAERPRPAARGRARRRSERRSALLVDLCSRSCGP